MKRGYIGIIAGVVVLGIVLTLSLVSRKKDGREVSLEASCLKRAESAFNSGRFLEAKSLYKEGMGVIENAGQLRGIQKKIEEINIKVILSPIMDECGIEYIVKPGDALSKIAKKFKTTINFIKRSNNLASDIIRPNQRLKINTCSFSIVVDKSQNLLFLKREAEVVKTYIVATGKDNSTPIGTFHISNEKLVNPTWYKTGAIIPPDSPDNILGSRWMGLEGSDSGGFDIGGYGIHGTTMPDELGKQITLGCVRMKNEDVEELFDIVSVGTEVMIID